jgi:hypothetical protein
MRIVVVGVLLLATACGGKAEHDGQSLLGGSDMAYGSSIDALPNRPYTLGGLLVCTKGRPFVLDSVRAALIHGSGKLEDVGVRSSPASEGSIDMGQFVLPAVMGPVKGYRVSSACGSSDRMVSELAIQVSRGDGYGEVAGLRVRYHVGSTSYVSVYRYTATMCDPAAHDNPEDCDG